MTAEVPRVSNFSETNFGKVAIGAAVTCVVTAVAAGVIAALATQMGGAYVPAIATTGTIAGLSLLIAGGFGFIIKREITHQISARAPAANETFAREETSVQESSEAPLKPVLIATRGLLVAAVRAYHARKSTQPTEEELYELRMAFNPLFEIVQELNLPQEQLQQALAKASSYINAGLIADTNGIPEGAAKLIPNSAIMLAANKVIDELPEDRVSSDKKAQLKKAVAGLLPHIKKYVIAARFDEGWNRTLKGVFRTAPRVTGSDLGTAGASAGQAIKGWADAINPSSEDAGAAAGRRRRRERE